MKLAFEKLQIENFMSFVGPPVTIDLGDRGVGLHFIKGKNEVEPRLGANDCGKTTIWAALTWCLYGRTVNGLRNPDIAPWNSKHAVPTSVTAWVQLDGDLHVVRRQANPNIRLLDSKATDDAQIEKLLGLGFETFAHTILLGQGRPLFFDLPAREKLELFSLVLNLERWDQYSKDASDETIRLQGIHDTLDGKLDGLDKQIQTTTELVEKTKVRSREWEDERTRVFETADAELKKLRTKLEWLTRKRDLADVNNDMAETELRAIRKELGEVKYEHLTIKTRFETTDQTNTREIKRLREFLDTVGDTKNCPTCGQPLKGTKLLEHIGEVEHQIKLLKRIPKDRESTPVFAQFNELAERITRLEQAEERYATIADNTQSRLNLLNPRVGELQGKIDSLVQAQNERAETTNPFQEQIQDLRRQKERSLKELREGEDRLVKLKRKIVRTKYWIKGYKDVKLYIIGEVLQELELTTNVMLESIGLDDWSVRYAVDKETKSGGVHRGLNVQILSPRNTQLVKWDVWGGGVGQRLRLIGALAFGHTLLNHAGVQPTIEIFDEPTAHLSSQGVKDLVQLLADRAQSLQKQIWLVDHRAIESSLFTSSITVVKTKQGSLLQ